MYGSGSAIKAASLNHLLPTESEISKEQQTLSSGRERGLDGGTSLP